MHGIDRDGHRHLAAAALAIGFDASLSWGREALYLGFFYRNWGARPDAISEEAQQEYLRTYRQPGAMRYEIGSQKSEQDISAAEHDRADPQEHKKKRP